MGLETGAFNDCLDSDRYLEVVKQEFEEGRARGVRGTPTLFVNGELIENGGLYEVLQAAVQAALEE